MPPRKTSPKLLGKPSASGGKMCCNLLVHCISASNDAAFAAFAWRAASTSWALGAVPALGFGGAWLGTVRI